MKIRQHRGGYAESMATTEEIEPTVEAVAAAIDRVMAEGGWQSSNSLETVKVESYGGVDPRNGWDTHVVTFVYPDGARGVFGFTDGPLESPLSLEVATRALVGMLADEGASKELMRLAGAICGEASRLKEVSETNHKIAVQILTSLGGEHEVKNIDRAFSSSFGICCWEDHSTMSLKFKLKLINP